MIVRSFDIVIEQQGYERIPINPLVFLLFGIYCFIICVLYFIEVNKLWYKDDSIWKVEMKSAYKYAFWFSVSLAVLMVFPISSFDVIPKAFFVGLIIVSPVLLFSLGIVLLILWFLSRKRKKIDQPDSYLSILFITAIVFILAGAFPTWIIMMYWTGNLNIP